MLTVNRLKEVLSYEPQTGTFTRRIGCKGQVAGTIAGCKTELGYIRIGIDGQAYYAQRLAWLHMTGEWPCGEVDHINRNPSDNSWKNLRETTASINRANTRLRRNNKSGFRGVSWDKRNRKWVAMLTANRRQKYLGLFDSAETAHAAYCEAAKPYFGERPD